jgi:hypothetical protein
MAKKNTKRLARGRAVDNKVVSTPRFAQPDPDQDEKALVEHYKQVLTDDTDEQGIGPKDIEKLGKLITVLKDPKKKK